MYAAVLTLIGALATLTAMAGPCAAAEEFDTRTPKPLIDMMRDHPNAIPLDPRDPSKDVTALNRDCHDNPKREPGPINIQKTSGGFAYQGIPTFFRAPVALCPEDLKAGKVDIAIMGAPLDLSLGTRGTAWGPQAVRTGEATYPWGKVMSLAHPTVGDIDFMQVLKVVDYGDAAGALADIGLPTREIPVALMFFNVGVELGQILFVAAVLGMWQSLKRLPYPRSPWVKSAPFYVVGAVAMFWFIDRVCNMI